MKTKTDTPATKEEYHLTEKQFTTFAKSLVAVPKKELESKTKKASTKRGAKRPKSQ